MEKKKYDNDFKVMVVVQQMNASRGIDKALISNLATGEYITKGEALLITGATRCGKSFLASALVHHA
jgi:DNA replication protein DnaC